jgi:hypothetical protein
MKKINPIGVWPNLSRAYEIAKLGNFGITITYQQHGDYLQVSDDYETIKKFYSDVKFVPDGEIWLELTPPKDYTRGNGCETLADIHARVEKAKGNLKPVKYEGEACMELLKNATDKLHFSAKDIDIINEVAEVIAQLDGENMVYAHHVAEAIQYRIKYGFEDNLMIADNSIMYFGKYIQINRAGLKSMWSDEEENIKEARYFLFKMQ